MQRRLQKLAMLTEQNVRLRELLNSAALVDDKVIVSELIGLDPNPFTHRILIDKVLVYFFKMQQEASLDQLEENLRVLSNGEMGAHEYGALAAQALARKTRDAGSLAGH